MYILYKLFFLIAFFPFSSQPFKLKPKDAVFKESYVFVKKSRGINLNDLPNDKIGVEVDHYCSKIILSKDGKSIEYKDIQYIGAVFIRNPKKKLYMNVNGIKIKGKKLRFELIKNCSEVAPYYFTSNANQIFRGIQIKTDESVTWIGHYNKDNGILEAGVFNKYGYVDENFKIGISEKQKIKDLKNNDFSNPRYRSVTGNLCTEIQDKKGQGYKYIVFGKIYDKKNKHEGHINKHASLYHGNAICNNNIELTPQKFFCNQEYSWKTFFGKDSFFNYNLSNNEAEIKTLALEDVYDAKKCEAAIKKYEKKHKIKIPESVLVPENAKALIKAGRHPGYEYWKKGKKQINYE